ncbi:MAG: lytic transglycosylase domain-containing protein [Defluviitaleaceae bacterium]|nr:lytic transglycosylase domain-containing protein [Defluviitaleaceae bacterium]
MKKLKLLLFPIIILGALFALYLFNTNFPLRYLNIIEHYAQIHDVDPVLVASIINVESRFDRYAVSHAGASGLMQLMPNTAVWAAEELGIEDFYFDEMVFDPHININIGTWYIRSLLDSHHTMPVALAAYNAGRGNVASWLANPNYSVDGYTLTYIPFGETRRYVDMVLLSMHAYRLRLWLGI